MHGMGVMFQNQTTTLDNCDFCIHFFPDAVINTMAQVTYRRVCSGLQFVPVSTEFLVTGRREGVAAVNRHGGGNRTLATHIFKQAGSKEFELDAGQSHSSQAHPQ